MVMRRLTFVLALVAAVWSPHPSPAAVWHEGGAVYAETATCRVAMDSRAGLAWRQIWVRGPVRSPRLLDGGGGPVLQVAFRTAGSDFASWYSSQCRADVTPGNGDVRIRLTPHDGGAPVVHLTISDDGGSEILFTAKVTAKQDGEVMLALPIIDGLLADQASEVTCFYPRDSGILSSCPVDLASTYGQYVRMQVMAASVPGAGGIHVICRDDQQLLSKTFQLRLRVPGRQEARLWDEYGARYLTDAFAAKSGVSMAVRYQPVPVKAGQPRAFPTVAVGVDAGDWRDALAAYRAWANTWYRPHLRPSFRRIFGHASLDLFSETRIDDALRKVDAAGPLDFVEYMVQAQHVNGEYGYREDIGLPELQRFSRELLARGIGSSHYVEGYIAAPTSRVWQEHPDWGQHLNGEQLVLWGVNRAMCLDYEPWRRWIAGESARLARDLGLQAAYLDELGFATGEKQSCDNPAHSHPEPFIACRGVRALLRTTRAALNEVDPEIAIYTEGPAVAELSNYCDGTEEYFCRQELWAGRPFYEVPVHFGRFVFPEPKFLQIPDGDRAERLWQYKKTLFNGLGWVGPLVDDEVEPFRHRMTEILRENREAFSTLRPEPLVATRHPGVYANRFTSDTKTVLTLCNANDYPVAGALVSVAETEGRHWVDLTEMRDARVVTIDGRPCLVASLDARDVKVFAALPRRLDVAGEGQWLSWVESPAELVKLDNADAEVARASLTAREGSLVDMTDQGRNRAVLKLMQGGELLDLVPLPRLGDIDLALVARASAGYEPEDGPVRLVNDGNDQTYWHQPWDAQPRPPWVRLDWDHPQVFNEIVLRAAEGVYASQDFSVEASEDGETFREVARVSRIGQSEWIRTEHFAAVTAKALRLTFHKGGPWGDNNTVQTLSVWYKG